MELSNKRTQYTVINSNDKMKLVGELMINSDNLISSFNGQLYDVNDNYVGEFYFNEPRLDVVNKNVSNVKASILSDSEDFITETIDTIKENI